MTIQETIQSQMTDAMRNKDRLRLSVLRMMKTAVKNKEIEKMKPLDENEVMAVLNTLVKQRKDSVEQFRKGGREELAKKEEAEIKIIEEYLPAAASEDDIRKAIDEAVQETGAASIKDMGKVMKAALARLAGKSADGSRVSQMAKEKLSS
ncbi:MAG TPA: GatB/YqeY domain-containing protein [Terriglobia bacterium]|nr:GatB/YqeY domain-containing protein [Terriglobia bacterium]